MSDDDDGVTATEEHRLVGDDSEESPGSEESETVDKFEKSIGDFGSFALLTNNMTGPGKLYMLYCSININ